MTEVLARGSVEPTLKREVEVGRRREARRGSAVDAAILACGGLGLLVIVGGPVVSLVSLFFS